MHADEDTRESRLEDRARLIIVESPDMAAPLIDALDVADIGAWMWVEAERALYLSPRVLDLLGLSAVPHAELLTRFLDGVHSDELAVVTRLVRRELDAGRFELRYRFTPPDGPLRWIEDRGRVERGDDGTLLRQGGALRDATREVGRELERRETDARLEALVNAMPVAVWGRSGPELTVTHQNAASIATWGDLRGLPLDDSPVDVRELWRAQIAAVMTGQVVDIRRDANAVVQTAYLQPAADFDKLEYVLVILDYEGGLPPIEEQPVDCTPARGGTLPEGEQPCQPRSPRPSASPR